MKIDNTVIKVLSESELIKAELFFKDKDVFRELENSYFDKNWGYVGVIDGKYDQFNDSDLNKSPYVKIIELPTE